MNVCGRDTNPNSGRMRSSAKHREINNKSAESVHIGDDEAADSIRCQQVICPSFHGIWLHFKAFKDGMDTNTW